MNELLSVEDTLAVTAGRTWHAFHVEGCGGGHWPDTLALAGRERILTSSTTPTVPFGVHAEAEHLAMVPAVHVLAPGRVHGDSAIVRHRVRAADDGGRGPAARPRRDRDALERLAGHGPRRRGRAPRVPERRRDARAARGRAGRRPTTSACCAISRRSRSTRRSRTGWRRTSARSSRASSPTSCSGTRTSSACGPSSCSSRASPSTAPPARATPRRAAPSRCCCAARSAARAPRPALLSLAFMARAAIGAELPTTRDARAASRAVAT